MCPSDYKSGVRFRRLLGIGVRHEKKRSKDVHINYISSSIENTQI